MLKKRIIPCLDIMNGRTVKGTNFRALHDAGDPVELAKRYADEGADELVFLDITATRENRKTFVTLVEEIAFAINIPFTVGGGIGSVDDIRLLLNSGADKVSINSAAFRHPNVISQAADQFGSQCIVTAIDIKSHDNKWLVCIDGGHTSTDTEAVYWARTAESLGAGEILLTSMDADGTRGGFSVSILDDICKNVTIPVIASGGAGKREDFLELFTSTDCSAALAAGIFHYGDILISDLKDYLKTNKIEIR